MPRRARSGAVARRESEPAVIGVERVTAQTAVDSRAGSDRPDRAISDTGKHRHERRACNEETDSKEDWMNRVGTRAELHRRAQHAMLLGAMRTTRAQRTPRVKRPTWIAPAGTYTHVALHPTRRAHRGRGAMGASGLVMVEGPSRLSIIKLSCM